MNVANRTVIGGLVQQGLREFLREPRLLNTASASLMQIGADESKSTVLPIKREPHHLLNAASTSLMQMGAEESTWHSFDVGAAEPTAKEAQGLFASLQLALMDAKQCMHIASKKPTQVANQKPMQVHLRQDPYQNL